jgi:hypothetical protein
MGGLHEGQFLASPHSMVTSMGRSGDIEVAKRQFFWHSSPDQSVTLTIGRPRETEGGSEWTCQFEVRTIERSYSHDSRGEDSLQALQLALRAAAVYLEQMNGASGGDLRWLDDSNRDLGFGKNGSS